VTDARPIADPRPTLLRRTCFSAILRARRVYVVSYQNSGRTWLRVMLGDLGIKAKFTHAGAAYRYRFGPDAVCSNLNAYRHRRIVFLVRDPLDAIVSNYFQASMTDGVFQGDMKAFLRDPHWGLARMLAFNAGWYAARARFRDFHLVRYETMVTHTADELAGIVNFMKLPNVARSDIESSAERNRFETMKQREIAGDLYRQYGDRFSQGGRSDDEGLKVRRGKIGGYRDYLDDADIEFARDLIRKSDYPL
jgi:hypothetical protein